MRVGSPVMAATVRRAGPWVVRTAARLQTAAGSQGCLRDPETPLEPSRCPVVGDLRRLAERAAVRS
ncbi:hypothetical protein [Actinoplanes palleronii]|uniref:Uncharacterized protein n=1 Tax=Actinoplanes palleronii TaxID=113570 RepID=A0ABQ4BR96_9ACTN|nr:hypothetical protein [Actinoplanes palleronii]GIE73175.1 hypothetical protein Apa02nite_092830 [Actinoplanes palleronii]